MLTAKDGEYDEADAFDLGADDYLTKPFSYVVLVARLRALIRRGAPERPAVLTAGDLTLDPAAHRVAAARRSSPHPARVRAARFFAAPPRSGGQQERDPGDVWDTDYDRDDNIVEVYVGYLRKKIDAPFGRNSIDTVRGVGYRMVGTSRWPWPALTRPPRLHRPS